LEWLLGNTEIQKISYRALRGRAGGYAGAYITNIPIVPSLDAAANHGAAELVDAGQRQSLTNLRWELQIHTAMQEAWSRLSHARFYKDAKGIPYRNWRQLDRLAAVVDLLDDQLREIESDVARERERVFRLVSNRRERLDLDVDEYVLLASLTYMQEHLVALRDLGSAAGFKDSEWSELVRIGDETDICLAVCATTGIRTMRDFLHAVDKIIEASDHNILLLRTIFGVEEMESLQYADGGTGDKSRVSMPFDRPLLVFSLLRLAESPSQINSVLELRISYRRKLLKAWERGVFGSEY
nr:hypothetical protein [Micromonospora sp. DSM 115978]